MDLYFLPLACSLATRIAIEESGLDARYIEVDPRTKTLLESGRDYREINPLALVPALRTDEGEILTENIAVLHHVGRQSSELWPEDQTHEVLRWLSFVSTELHTGLFAAQFDRSAETAVKEHAQTRGAARLAHLDQHLQGREYLLDRFTVADAYLITVLHWTRGCDVDLKPYPAVKRYLETHLKRASVAGALAIELPLFMAEQQRVKSA